MKEYKSAVTPKQGTELEIPTSRILKELCKWRPNYNTEHGSNDVLQIQCRVLLLQRYSLLMVVTTIRDKDDPKDVSKLFQTSR